MKQTLLALLVLCLLAAFGSPAQACAHGPEAVVSVAHQAQMPETQMLVAKVPAPQAPAHCPPASTCKLHFCCTPPLVAAAEPQSFVLAFTLARFTPAMVIEPQPTVPPTLEKPPKAQG
jgi:hypothetical protein